MITIELKDQSAAGNFDIHLGGIFIYRWDGADWIEVGEIYVFGF